MKSSLKIPALIIGICLLFGFSHTLFAADSEKEVKASLSISATVPTVACAQFSSVTKNVSDLLSDSSQRVLITAKVNDCTNQPIVAASVIVTSNRGQIDTITPVTSSGTPITIPIGQKGGLTDVNGYAFFEVRSNVPGEALFSTLIDGTISLDQTKIIFLPLPFPKNVTVTIEVPRILAKDGNITLFRPAEQEIDKEKMVNMGVEFRLPQWVGWLLFGLFFLNVILFAVIIFLSVRIGRYQKITLAKADKELDILAKEEKEIEEIKNKG